MRVLQVGSSLYDWGGIERYVLYLSQGLAERGHEVEVICPPGSPLHRRCDILVAPARSATGMSHLLVRPIALKGQFNFLQLPSFLRLFRQNRYDVVHVHFSPDFVIPAMAARMTKQPLVMMTRHVVLPWSRAKVRRYTKLFDHFIAVSEASRARLLSSGVPAEFVTVAKAGCPALVPKRTREAVRRVLGIPLDGLAVGSFGRLVKEKGIDVLLDAAELLPENAEVHAFGEGVLSTLGRTRGGRVKFHGFVPEVADAMSAMDIVAVPSVWEEAFPYAVLEAMSLGLPIVASNVGGLPEMVTQETGLLVPKRDPSALANALGILLRDEALRKHMGAAAKELHASQYTIARMAERIEAVYLAASRTPSA